MYASKRKPEIVVVGGGIIGCAIAYELSRRGASVAVFDMREIGAGATQASAGMLVPYLEGHGGGPLLDLALKSFALYDAFVRDVRGDTGTDLEYTKCGSLQVTTDSASAAGFAAAAPHLASVGVLAEYLDGDAARRSEPHLTGGLAGGLLVRDHGFVVASQLVTALAQAAGKFGARFHRTTAIRRIAGENGGLRVDADDRSLAADYVVLAAGAWCGQIQGLPATVPVRPVRGQLLQLEWPGMPPRRIVWGDGCYVVPRRDGTVLVGATAEEAGFDERATVAGVRDLLEAVCDLMPAAWRAGFRTVKVGLRPASPDELPLVGPSGTMRGLVYATAHYRNGVLLAPLTANVVADLILDGRSDPLLEMMSPSRMGL